MSFNTRPIKGQNEETVQESELFIDYIPSNKLIAVEIYYLEGKRRWFAMVTIIQKETGVLALGFSPEY